MADPNPIRPGADPQLNLASAGLVGRPDHQPTWSFLTQVLVRWMRWHFAAATRIEHPDLVGRVWVGNETTPIQISSLAEWKPEASNQRPAILVDRLEQKPSPEHRVLAQQFQGIRPGQYIQYMGGAHVIHCLGGRDGEAENLAFEVWRELSRYANVAREALCLVRFQPVQIGKRVQMSEEEYKQHYTVPVVVEYFYSENWKVYPTDESAITAILTGLPVESE